MRKFGYAAAALAAIAIAAPSIANADTVVIKKRYHHPFDSRAEFREHRDFGLHEGWRHRGDKTVIIKHRRGYEAY